MGDVLFIGSTNGALHGLAIALAQAWHEAHPPQPYEIELGEMIDDDDRLRDALRRARFAIFFVAPTPSRRGEDGRSRTETEVDIARAVGTPFVVLRASEGALPSIHGPWSTEEADAAWRAFLDGLDAAPETRHVASVAALGVALHDALEGAALLHEPIHELTYHLKQGHLPRPLMAGPPDALEEAPPESAAAGAEESPPAPRHVNVAIARADTGEVVPRDLALARGREYALRLGIGARREDDLTAGDAPPVHESVAGSWLAVVVGSATFAVAAKRHWIFLPQRGEAWVCACPREGEHSCTPASRADALRIPVRAPARGDVARLRIVVYCRNNVVQSRLLTAKLAKEEAPATDAQGAVVDYTLSEDLESIATLPPRRVGVLTNDEDGTHRIVLNGDKGDPLVWHLTEKFVSGALEDVRGHLRAIHVADPKAAPEASVSALRADNGKDLAQMRRDLRRLATYGRELFTALATADGGDHFARLADLIGQERADIQIARAKGTGLAFPWAFVYDVPLDADETRWVDCPRMASPADLGDVSRTSCDHGGLASNVVCPFGFWGVRHSIEQPPSSKAAVATPTVLAPQGATILCAVHAKLDFPAHAPDLHALGPRLKVAKAATKRELEASVAADDVAILYFYCHGREERIASRWPTVTLLVGSDESVSPSDVLTWFLAKDRLDQWSRARPLVFVNGCHTVRVSPESPTNFIDTFATARAAGVIGTEIHVTEPFAQEAARVVLGALAQGKDVGAAMRELRHALLRKGNVLGLAYTAYSMSGVKLAGA